MSTLFVEWTDPIKKTWHTVGKLKCDNSTYTFEYSEMAKKLDRFRPFGRMADLDTVYESDDLFPLFSNRIINRSRPEFKVFLRWLDLEEDAEPMSILAASHGLRSTDSLRIYSLPEEPVDSYNTNFFVSGVSHTARSKSDRIDAITSKERLYIMDDVQNSFENALAIRTGEPKAFVGYVPSFLSHHLKEQLSDADTKITIKVVKQNDDAPPKYAILCNLKVENTKGRKLFNYKY